MTLNEYCEEFHRLMTGETSNGHGFTTQIGAEVAAAHEIGLTFEQLRRFLARRTEITSVATALVGPRLSVDAIERILEARRSGAVYPKDVLAMAFSPDEIHERFRGADLSHISDDA